VFQRQIRFARDWNGENAENISSELEEANRLHQELKSWLLDFEAVATELTRDEIDQNVPIQISTLRIIAQ